MDIKVNNKETYEHFREVRDIKWERDQFMKGVYSLMIFILLFTISPMTFANTIWKIGIDNNSNSEFGLPGVPGSDPNLSKLTVKYVVQQDTNSQTWRSFPSEIWPVDSSDNPKEIHITYSYQKEYKSTVIRIKACSAFKNFTQKAEVQKGDPSCNPQGLTLPSIYVPFEFPMGPMQKGYHDDNKIIIKNISLTDDNHPIFFDYIELYDQDQDNDGSIDTEEREGDLDNDGHENVIDPDTATVLIKGYDESKSEWFILDIMEEGDFKPYFTGLRPLDKDLLPTEPQPGLFFPLGFFEATIKDAVNRDILRLRIIYPEYKTIYETAGFYVYFYGNWEDMPLDIVAKNMVEISIGIDKERDYDPNAYSQEDGEIRIIGGLAYPSKLPITLDETSCFINSTSLY